MSTQEGSSRSFLGFTSLCSVILGFRGFSYSPRDVATVHSEAKSCHCLHNAGFSGIQNARVVKLGMLQPRFPKKAMQEAPEKAVCEPGDKVITSVVIPGSWRYQECDLSTEESCR